MADYVFKIDGYSRDGKHFMLSNSEISMRVNNDDVDESRTAAAAEYSKNLLNKHWDGDEYNAILKKKVMERWNQNEYNLQSDYESLGEYLSIYNLTEADVK